MPELIIKYKDKHTLDVLIAFSKYFNFTILLPKSKSEEESLLINGVKILSGNSSIDSFEKDVIF